MTDRFRFLPAVTCLAALSALALPARVQAAAATPAAAAPQRSSFALDVADQQQPRRHANRRGADRRGDTADGQADQLNETSLQRARQGQNAPGAGPDTTSNLNSMSEQDAARGRNTGGRPMMPFR